MHGCTARLVSRTGQFIRTLAVPIWAAEAVDVFVHNTYLGVIHWRTASIAATSLCCSWAVPTQAARAVDLLVVPQIGGLPASAVATSRSEGRGLRCRVAGAWQSYGQAQEDKASKPKERFSLGSWPGEDAQVEDIKAARPGVEPLSGSPPDRSSRGARSAKLFGEVSHSAPKTSLACSSGRLSLACSSGRLSLWQSLDKMNKAYTVVCVKRWHTVMLLFFAAEQLKLHKLTSSI
eukprot:1159496-Pelagomonas_calceolata.AAC.2